MFSHIKGKRFAYDLSFANIVEKENYRFTDKYLAGGRLIGKNQTFYVVKAQNVISLDIG